MAEAILAPKISKLIFMKNIIYNFTIRNKDFLNVNLTDIFSRMC